MKTFRFPIRKLRPVVSLSLLVLAGWSSATIALPLPNPDRSVNAPYHPVDQPVPSPDLSPAEVIAIQLKALQQNDGQDNGIEVAFNFASPTNKAATGPLNRFKLLVRNPLYESMLNFRSFRAGKVVMEKGQAHQVIIVTDQQGNQAAFLFSLSKQNRAPHRDCWMTDSVVRLEIEPIVET